MNIVLNAIYALICAICFLVQRGTIVFDGTIEYGRFTDEFQNILSIANIVIFIVGVITIVISFKFLNQSSGFKKTAYAIALVCAIGNCALILMSNSVGIFFAGSIVATVMMLISNKKVN